MPPPRRMTRPAADAVGQAAAAALAELDLTEPSEKFVAAVVQQLAHDADDAVSGRDRVAVIRELLAVADRLDLVPPPPGRSAGAAPPQAQPPAGRPVEDNPFDVPDEPPAPPTLAVPPGGAAP